MNQEIKAMPKAKKKLVETKHDGCFVRAWAEGRGRNREYAVQVWLDGEGMGDPDGDWGMPAIIGLQAAISQAVLNTKNARRN